MKAPLARRILLGLAALCVLEWGAAALAYRTRVGAADWERLNQVVSSLPADEPVFLASPWLGSRARMHVPALRTWVSTASPDLRGHARFHVIGFGGDRWSPELSDDLEDLPPPIHDGVEEAGPLRLHHYRSDEPSDVLASLVDSPLQIETRDPCTRSSTSWKCKEGTVKLRTVEVDYRPRRCLAIDLEGGTSVRIVAPSMATGNVIRGHVGFDDFNRRLRSDAPVEISLLVNGTELARWTVSDEQGWWPFAARTLPGTHEVALVVRPSQRGTWQRKGYSQRAALSACVELRALREASE